MPGASPQSGITETFRAHASRSSFFWLKTISVLPPRSAQCRPTSTAARATSRLKYYGRALSTALWPCSAARSAAPSCTSSLTTAKRFPTRGLRKAGRRSGRRSASVTFSTSRCCSRSYAQADPCNPEPNTSIRIANEPPAAPTTASGGKASEGRNREEPRRGPSRHIRFAADEPGRPHAPAPRARRAGALHHAGIPRHHDAADREEGGRGGREHLPSLRRQTAPPERAVPRGGPLGREAREGDGRAAGGTAGKARRARPRARPGSGARARGGAALLAAAPRRLARRREPQGRSGLPAGIGEPDRSGEGGRHGEARRGGGVGGGVAQHRLARGRSRVREGVAGDARGRDPGPGWRVGCDRGN